MGLIEPVRYATTAFKLITYIEKSRRQERSMHYAKRTPRGIEKATSAGVYEEIQAAVKGAVIRLYTAPSTRSPFPPRARLWRRQSEGTAVYKVKE